MIVLQVLPALDSGGVERGTLEVGKFLVQQGHRSLVMSAGGRLVAQLEREGSSHFAWPVGAKSLWTLRLIWKLRRFLIEQGVDIVHVRSRMPGWICYLAWKGMDPATRPRLVTTAHGFYSSGVYSSVMMRGERTIAVSESISSYILGHYSFVDPSTVRVIHRGIDPEQYPDGYTPDQEWQLAWSRQFPALTGKRLIVLAGRITRLKGHHDFIRLIATLKEAHPDVHGLIVGEVDPRHQPYMDELVVEVARMGLQDNITFTGYRSDLREIFSISALVVSLSSQAEAFGRSVLEALALGVPVVAYAHGGVKEVLNEIFPQGQVELADFAALSARCSDLLSNQKKAKPVPRKFMLARMLQETLNVYGELLKDRKLNAAFIK